MNQVLLDKIKNEPRLPSLPVIAIRVLELAKQETASLQAVAKVISSDPALSAKVIRTVNSSFYGLPHRVGTINHALVLLGMETVKTLALGFSLVGGLNAKKHPKFDYLRFWRQSLYSAVAARALDKALKRGTHEEAFLAGLLSDIGTLAMHQAIGEPYDELLAISQGDQVELIRLSRQKFNLDHADVGGMLAEHWKFPQALVEPIRQHHQLTGRGHQFRPLTEIVYLGVLCGQTFSAKRTGLIQLATRELKSRFQFDSAKINSLFALIDAQTKELADLFDVRISPGRSYGDIEQEARQMLVELTLQTQMRSQQLASENKNLEKQAATDGLTGLANRSGLVPFLADAFAESQRTGEPLSLLFVDIDKFKAVNDTHGHQAGDVVLDRLGKLLQSHAKSGDLAARYGGEEMVVVLKKCDCQRAIEAAESIRAAIQAECFDFAGNSFRVTASVGVATDAPGGGFGSPDELIAAADHAVYSAKNAGRNCVRDYKGGDQKADIHDFARTPAISNSRAVPLRQ
ncbi:MAG: GGDEF domain-containing protein [Tepidisphaeraceae bacterium]|jgi:diguanylate cyclase (GGDEF)-like protein